MKITFVGLGGCPFSNRAADVRQGAFAEMFVRLGYEVEIINRFSATKSRQAYTRYRVVEPFARVRTKGRLVFVLFYVLALLQEPFRLLHSHWRRRIDVLFVYSAHTVDHLLYRLFCWVVGAKMVSQYNEYNSLSTRKSLYFRFNRRFIDSRVPKWWDGCICISHFLEQECHKVSPMTQTMLVYPLCDFKTYAPSGDDEPFHTDGPYLLFCSSVSYAEVVGFIIKAYHQSGVASRLRLVMVLSGNEEHISRLISRHPDVIFLHDLPYTKLMTYYRQARALLVPLRGTTRDRARFPHKVCEYLASGSLVVTTDQGEMPYVFHDGDNALVAEGYDVQTFARKLDLLADNDDHLEAVRQRGYQTGLRLFDIGAYQEQVDGFLRRLVTKDRQTSSV